MSMTLTLNPQMQKMAEWVKIFPAQVTESYTSSVTFMKQLTVVAISTITYLKNLFPEDSFTTEHFGGVRLQILKKDCEHELAQFVSTAIMQAFEAFDKRYLHQLVLCFYDGDCIEQNLVEYHIFEYKYNPEGMTMNVRSKTQNNVEHSAKYAFDNIKERTIHMIRACVVLMETCRDELPESFDVSVRLYYNKDAPEGYQAPGFLRPEECRDHLESTLRHTIKLGCVETPFHSVTPRTYIKDNYLSTEPAVNSFEKLTPVSDDDFNASSPPKSPSASVDIRIQCPCNKYDTDDELLTCQVCNSQQHAACFGVARADAALRRRHCCVACAAARARACTDAHLLTLSVKRRECMCVLRRTLRWCARRRALSASELMDKFRLAPLYATKLLNILHAHQVVSRGPRSDLVSHHPVNSEELKRVMNLFFSREDSQAPSTISNRSDCSVPEESNPPEQIQTPESLPKETNSLKQKDKNNVESTDVVISKGGSLAEEGGYNQINGEEVGRAGKRKKNRLLGAGVKTKRAKAQSE